MAVKRIGEALRGGLVGDLVSEATQLWATVNEALADGRITLSEWVEITRQLSELLSALAGVMEELIRLRERISKR